MMLFTSLQSWSKLWTQCLILGMHAASAQCFSKDSVQKVNSPTDFSFTVMFFSSNVMYKENGTSVNSSTTSLNPIRNLGSILLSLFRKIGQMPMDFRIHLVCFKT